MTDASQLKEFAVFSEFGDEDRDVLMELFETIEVRAGRRLFRAGSASDGMALVVSGRVELSSPRSSETAQLGPGTLLGTVSLVTVGKHEATAKAVSPCELLFLERSRFRRLVDDYPRTACRLLEALLGDMATSTRAALDELVPSSKEG